MKRRLRVVDQNGKAVTCRSCKWLERDGHCLIHQSFVHAGVTACTAHYPKPRRRAK